MTRSFLIVAAFSFFATAQVGVKIRWTCPKEGRFNVSHCKGCSPHYCMDGQHFHASEGPIPEWVLGYFEELRRRSEEISRQLEAKSAELRAAHAASAERAKQMNAQSAAAHEAFLQRVKSGRHGNSPRMLQPAPGGVAAAPDVAVAPRVVSREEIGLVKIGDNRGDVVARLGTPASAITIPGDDGTVERLAYRTGPDRTARINLRDGRVVEISLP